VWLPDRFGDCAYHSQEPVLDVPTYVRHHHPRAGVGAIAERMRFSAYVLFTVLFSLLVYAPLAHWSWHPDGLLAKMGALDFAGGTVVHISAGCAALAGALVLKRRKVHIDGVGQHPAIFPTC